MIITGSTSRYFYKTITTTNLFTSADCIKTKMDITLRGTAVHLQLMLMTLLTSSLLRDVTCARRMSEEELLMEDLFSRYKPSARPVLSSFNTVNVQMMFSLLKIQDLVGMIKCCLVSVVNRLVSVVNRRLVSMCNCRPPVGSAVVLSV